MSSSDWTYDRDLEGTIREARLYLSGKDGHPVTRISVRVDEPDDEQPRKWFWTCYELGVQRWPLRAETIDGAKQEAVEHFCKRVRDLHVLVELRFGKKEEM